MRKRGRIDANQGEIIKSLRQVPNLSVVVTSNLGDGFADIVVGYGGQNFLFELKNEKAFKSDKKLTEDEKRFRDSWRGQYSVAENVNQIFAVINETIRSGKFKSSL